jgi:hypothetical protein
VSVNEDAGGLPGDAIQSFTVSDLPIFGTCCEVQASNVDIPVSAGSQYWLVLAPSEDSEGVWNWNVTHQTTQAFAVHDGVGWPHTSGLLGAFALLGTQ